MAMNIFTSFFSLCYRHSKPCQHCRLQSSPQTLLQWLDTPAFQRKGPLEKAKEWLPLFVNHVFWGYCLPAWLGFNLLAGINPPLLVWGFTSSLCGRADAGTAAASTQAPAPVPTLRLVSAVFALSRLWEHFTAQTAQLACCAPPTGLSTTVLQGMHLQRMTGPSSCTYSIQPYAQQHPVLRVSLQWITGLRACHEAWIELKHSSSSSSGEVRVLAYLLLPRKLNKADLQSRPNANNI